MNRILKISIIFFIFLFSIGIVSATSNSSETNINSITKTSTDNHYVVSPTGKGVGQSDGNLFETIDYAEEHDTKTTVNLKSGTYKFTNQTINGTYHSNRRLGRNNLKYISFIGNNTVFDAENVRFFNIQKGTTAEFINILFTGGGATSGGSIYSEGNLILKNCSFINSTAQRYGGTLYLRGNNIIENTDFTETHTTDSRGSGGAIYITNATLKMNNVTVDHAVANKTAGFLTAINSDMELNHLNINNTFFTDTYGDSEIIFTNNSHVMINNSLFANRSDEYSFCGGLLGLYDSTVIISNTTFNNFSLHQSRSSFGLIYNNKQMKLNNIFINNADIWWNRPLILNEGILNMTNLSFDDKSYVVLRNDNEAYLSGNFNNLNISNYKKLYLNKVYNSCVLINNLNKSYINDMYNSSVISYYGENYLSNIKFSNLTLGNIVKLDNISSCVEDISALNCYANNITSTNPASSWNINIGNVTNSYFNIDMSRYLNNVNFTNTTLVNMPMKAYGRLVFDNVSVINSNCGYVISFDEIYDNNANFIDNPIHVIFNNTIFMDNHVKSIIKANRDFQVIRIENSSFINNTFSSNEAVLVNNIINKQLKNNVYNGNNLTSKIIGNLSNTVLYKTPLKGTLQVVPNEIYNTTINTGKASIYVDNKLYGKFGVYDGVIYVSISDLSFGKHVIKVIYSDETHSFAPSEKTFNVTVADKILTKVIASDKYAFAGTRLSFNASVVDYNNRPITTGRMIIKINGITQTSITLRNTNKITYNYTVPNYTAKDYKLQYVYVGDKDYTRYEANKTLHVRNQSARITANNVVNYHDQTVTIKVRIVGRETGIPAAVGKVGFKINGQTAKINGQPIIRRVNDGLATFTYRIPKYLKANKYTIMVTFSGGRNLLETRTNTSTLTVKDHTTKINIKTKTIKQSKTNKIIAEVKDSISEIKTGTASLYLNDVKISETNIQNGQIVFNYYVPNTLLGKYSMRIYAKGQYTDGNNSKTTLTVVK